MKHSRVILLGIISLLFLSSFAMVGTSSAYTYVPPYSPTVSMTSYAQTNQNFTFYVNNTNGFSNYTVTTYIGGDNLTGMSPQNSIHDFQATNPDFKISFTTPAVAQNLYVTIVSSAIYDNQSVRSQTTYEVSISVPIVFHAQVNNMGTSPIYNLTVDFTLNGQTLPGNVTVPVVMPHQLVTVNYTYSSRTLTSGSYTLTVTAENNPLVQINGDTGSSTSHFYYGTPPNYTWIFYIVAIVVIFMFLMTYSAGRRPPGGVRQPKWRKK